VDELIYIGAIERWPINYDIDKQSSLSLGILFASS